MHIKYFQWNVSCIFFFNAGPSREVCCRPVGHGTMHSHLYAVQKADVNIFKRLFWEPQNRQDPVEGYQKPSPLQTLITNYLKDIFRQVDLSSDGSLENCLCKDICGFENNDYSKKLKWVVSKISTIVTIVKEYQSYALECIWLMD